jgi:hypothetical protein
MATLADSGSHGMLRLAAFGKLKVERGANLFKSSWLKLQFVLFDEVITFKDKEVRNQRCRFPGWDVIKRDSCVLCMVNGYPHVRTGSVGIQR